MIFIALLRAINVGGHGALPMADLRAVLESLGLTEVRTLLQSGNAIFEGGRASRATLEARIEKALAGTGLHSDVMVRTAPAWQALIEANPFGDEARDDPAHLLVMPLKSVPGRAQVDALRAAIRGRERVAADGDVLYAVYPDGVGRSKLTHALIERSLGTRGTARNWNTVMKLGAASAAL